MLADWLGPVGGFGTGASLDALGETLSASSDVFASRPFRSADGLPLGLTEASIGLLRETAAGVIGRETRRGEVGGGEDALVLETGSAFGIAFDVVEPVAKAVYGT